MFLEECPLQVLLLKHCHKCNISYHNNVAHYNAYKNK